MSGNSTPVLQNDLATQSTHATVGVASGAIAGNNSSRAEITVVNDSAAIVYLQLATTRHIADSSAPAPVAPTAVVGDGIRLNANGGAWFSSSYSGPVAAIATVAASNVTVCEV